MARVHRVDWGLEHLIYIKSEVVLKLEVLEDNVNQAKVVTMVQLHVRFVLESRDNVAKFTRIAKVDVINHIFVFLVNKLRFLIDIRLKQWSYETYKLGIIAIVNQK